MEKAAKEMMSGVKLGPGNSHGHLEVYQRDGKADEGVGLGVILISPPRHEDTHQGRQIGS